MPQEKIEFDESNSAFFELDEDGFVHTIDVYREKQFINKHIYSSSSSKPKLDEALEIAKKMLGL